MRKPFYTIVTPALNCAPYLRRNLESVRSQGLPADELEHWVIDGGSEDGTVELLNRWPGVKFVSERDRGLSHAVNKGIERSKGEWIVWLNADDELAPNALSQFQRSIENESEVFMFCGRQKIFGYDGALELITEPWDYNVDELLGGRTSICQASTFVHRSVYERVGPLDESYRFAMDYEWLVRAAHHYRTRSYPILLTHYYRRQGSIMDRGIANQHREFLRVRRRYHRSYLEPAEWRIRFYLLTDPLRGIPWLRSAVRRVKRICGHQPHHPVSC